MTTYKCRSCAETIVTPNPKNIFAHENEALLENIRSLTGLEFNYCEDLPTHICTCCYLDLQHAALFRERCIKAEQLLLEDPKLVLLDENEENEEDKDEDGKSNMLDPMMEYKMVNELDAVKSPGKGRSKLPLTSNYPRVLIKRLQSPVKKAEALEDVPPVRRRRKRKPYFNGDKKYTCEHCGWSFRDCGNMLAHRRTHGEPTFQCNECDRKFYTQPLLNLHIRVRHRNELPFICKYCGQGFPNSPARCRHERTMHPNELPFRCSICPKTFISKIGLDKHIQFHKDGEKTVKHICTSCNKQFVDYHTLKKHYLTKYHRRRIAEYTESDKDGESLASDGNFDEDDLAESLLAEEMDE
ncbi:transcription factor Ouib-like [Drosophila tropicalis]|uniref:transcription factor Ouib-like n=1 Tax=Drosophila tropicalis TaxID=46794 RepID=UPI0035AC01BA